MCCNHCIYISLDILLRYQPSTTRDRRYIRWKALLLLTNLVHEFLFLLHNVSRSPLLLNYYRSVRIILSDRIFLGLLPRRSHYKNLRCNLIFMIDHSILLYAISMVVEVTYVSRLKFEIGLLTREHWDPSLVARTVRYNRVFYSYKVKFQTVSRIGRLIAQV